MKRLAALVLTLSALVLVPNLASAQTLQRLCFPTNAAGTNCEPVSASNPYPVTGGGGGGGNVNIQQIGGNPVQTGHGTASGALRVELPTDGTGMVGLNAGTNNVGNVGGKTVTVCVTPTVTASNNYGTNYVVGGLLTFANAFTATGSGIIQSVNVNIKKVETNGFTFYPFASNPSNTTWTDAAVAAINANDVFAVRPAIQLSASSQLGTQTTLSAVGLGQAASTGATTLYGVLIANAALTNQFSSTSDVQVCVTVLQDL